MGSPVLQHCRIDQSINQSPPISLPGSSSFSSWTGGCCLMGEKRWILDWNSGEYSRPSTDLGRLTLTSLPLPLRLGGAATTIAIPERRASEGGEDGGRSGDMICMSAQRGGGGSGVGAGGIKWVGAVVSRYLSLSTRSTCAPGISKRWTEVAIGWTPQNPTCRHR